MTQEDSHNLEIVCGSCGAENTYPLSSPVKCEQCAEPLTGQDPYFRFGRRTLKGLKGAAVAGAVAGSIVIGNYVLDTDRYPVLVEHAIIEACLSQSRAPLPTRRFLKKREICACALEETQNELDAETWEEDRKKFVRVFKGNALQCGKE